jgi:hypothetical protein
VGEGERGGGRGGERLIQDLERQAGGDVISGGTKCHAMGNMYVVGEQVSSQLVRTLWINVRRVDL